MKKYIPACPGGLPPDRFDAMARIAAIGQDSAAQFAADIVRRRREAQAVRARTLTVAAHWEVHQ